MQPRACPFEFFPGTILPDLRFTRREKIKGQTEVRVEREGWVKNEQWNNRTKERGQGGGST
jgi:hypothetical protein